jgi:hypothetical protein
VRLCGYKEKGPADLWDRDCTAYFWLVPTDGAYPHRAGDPPHSVEVTIHTMSEGGRKKLSKDLAKVIQKWLDDQEKEK